MRFFTEAIQALGGVLLQVAALLLFEELSFAGLARLILAPRPAARKDGERKNQGESRCSR